MFKGFQFDLPSYTVITPQTGESYDVRSLTVAEVSKLKASLVTPSKAHNLVNDILWQCLNSKPDDIKDMTTFKKRITTLDREALLYGLYHTTFGDGRDFHVSCSACGNEQMLKLKLDKLFSMNAYPGSSSIKQTYKIAKAADEETYDSEIEELINDEESPLRESHVVEIPEGMPKELAIQEGLIPDDKAPYVDDDIGVGMKPNTEQPVTASETTKSPEENKVNNNPDDILIKKLIIDLPISKVRTILRQPTIYHEEQLLRELAFASKKQGDLVNETLIIDRFEQYKEGDKVPFQIVDKREDILWGYQSLPPRDKTTIFEEYQKNFGQYGIELKSDYECSKCGNENDLEINIAIQFFRMVGIS